MIVEVASDDFGVSPRPLDHDHFVGEERQQIILVRCCCVQLTDTTGPPEGGHI